MMTPTMVKALKLCLFRCRELGRLTGGYWTAPARPFCAPPPIPLDADTHAFVHDDWVGTRTIQALLDEGYVEQVGTGKVRRVRMTTEGHVALVEAMAGST